MIERKKREHVQSCKEAMFAMADPEKAREYFNEILPPETPASTDNVMSAERLRAILGG